MRSRSFCGLTKTACPSWCARIRATVPDGRHNSTRFRRSEVPAARRAGPNGVVPTASACGRAPQRHPLRKPRRPRPSRACLPKAIALPPKSGTRSGNFPPSCDAPINLPSPRFLRRAEPRRASPRATSPRGRFDFFAAARQPAYVSRSLAGDLQRRSEFDQIRNLTMRNTRRGISSWRPRLNELRS